MTGAELLQVTIGIVLIAASAFYAGWKAAQAYLPAARQVGDFAAVLVNQSNQFGEHLDRSEKAVASLQHEVKEHREGVQRKLTDVEEVLQLLFEGLARAGTVRPESKRIVPRQVGESPEV